MKIRINTCNIYREQCCKWGAIAFSFVVLLGGCTTTRLPSHTSAGQAPATPAIISQPSATPAPAPQPAATPPVSASVPVPSMSTTPLAPSSWDKAAVLRIWIEQQAHLYRVAAPLLINNTELCPRHTRKLLGFTAKNRYSYSEEFVAAAESAIGLGERLQVMSVLPGSGAEQAGLRKGDILHAVEIEPLPAGPNAERAGASLIHSELQGRDSVKLTVLRQGEYTSMDIPLTPACAMTIDLGNTNQINSFADGQRIMVTRGMLAFTQSEEELAYVLAKEIALNVLMPAPRPDIAALIDSLHVLTPVNAEKPVLQEILPYSQELDIRSDKLAMYMLAKGGYSLEQAPPFWQRLAQANRRDEHNRLANVHPESSGKFAMLAKTIEQIRKKQQLGEPLNPDIE